MEPAPSSTPVDVYRAHRLALLHQVAAVIVLIYFVGFAVLGSSEQWEPGQRALAIALGAVVAAILWRAARRRVELWPDQLVVCNYLTTLRLAWREVAEVRTIPAGLEIFTVDGRRLVASVLARWNWKPWLGGEPPVDDIARAVATMAGAARRQAT